MAFTQLNNMGGRGNLSNSGKIFTLQKKIVRIMVGARTETRVAVKGFPVPCQYVFSLISFIVNNGENVHIFLCTQN